MHDHTPVPTVAVKDLGSARQFYEGVLEFGPGSERTGGVSYTAGSGGFFLYESQFAGTNRATSMMFELPGDAFDAQVDALRGKGVSFQTYDMPGVTWQDGVASMSEGDVAYRSVWFEDPDGNILNFGTGTA